MFEVSLALDVDLGKFLVSAARCAVRITLLTLLHNRYFLDPVSALPKDDYFKT